VIGRSAECGGFGHAAEGIPRNTGREHVFSDQPGILAFTSRASLHHGGEDVREGFVQRARLTLVDQVCGVIDHTMRELVGDDTQAVRAPRLGCRSRNGARLVELERAGHLRVGKEVRFRSERALDAMTDTASTVRAKTPRLRNFVGDCMVGFGSSLTARCTKSAAIDART
jgi:hypothetical protein